MDVICRATVALLFSVVPAPAQNKLKSIDASAATPQGEVLLLGSYQMDNPGLDLHNTKADGVIAPKRQAESVVNWAKANGRSTQLDTLDRMGAEQAKADEDYLLSHTVLEMFRRLNISRRLCQVSASCHISAMMPKSTADAPKMMRPYSVVFFSLMVVGIRRPV